MIRNRLLLALTLSSLLAVAVWAGGKKEFTGQEVNGKENWDYTYDLADKKPGQYNLIIEGTDKAGNKTIAGPFNVWIDPESDVPVVTIINPVSDQRVGQNLNIVGTCVDDDGVDHVEIRLDGGEPLTASGTEYWSYYLNGGNLPDGRHTLSITGYDIKGVSSKPVNVSFNLDKFKPVNTITSHENGVLVSGNISLKGSVTDANGIARLEASTDGGKNFRDLGIRSGKDGSLTEFDLGIDTRTLKDGPNILWLRSTDRTRSIGVSAFLLMVDNTKPDIRILNPLPSMSVHGQTGFAGVVFDSVGVSGLSWNYGGKSGDIPLFPGNPFFTAEFDFKAETAKEALITFLAVDRAGNRMELRYPLKIDNEVDKPVVKATNLLNKDIIPPNFDIALHIRDDDGVGSVTWQLDQEAEQAQKTQESAVLPLRGLAPGPHSLALHAVDSLGVAGPVLTLAFSVKAPPPQPAITVLEVDGSPKFVSSIPDFLRTGSLPFLPGLRILQDGANVLRGNVLAGNKLKLAEWQLAGGKWQPLALTRDGTTGLSPWSIPLPKSLPFGINVINIRATDEYDQVGFSSALLYVINYSRINEEPAIVFLDSRLGPDDVVRLSDSQPLEGLFVGSEAQGIRLEPPSDKVKAELEGNRVIIRHLKDGLTEPTTVVVTSREGHDIRSRALVFRSDSTPPSIRLTAPLISSWVKSPLMLQAAIEDQGGIDAIEYSLDRGKSWLPSQANGGTSTELAENLSLDGINDGPLLLLVRARDKSGNETQVPQIVLKDTTPPVIAIETPLETAWGFTPVIGHVTDMTRLAKLQYRLGTGPFQDLPQASLDKRFVIPVDFGADRGEAVELAVRAVDLAGNETVESRSVGPGTAPPEPTAPGPDEKGKVPEPPKPQVTLITPLANEAVHGRIIAVFQLTDYLPTYPQVKFTATGQATRMISTGESDGIRNGWFVASIDLAAAKSGQITCTFDFEGSKRKSSVPVLIKASPDSDKPVSSIVWLDSAPGFAAAQATDDDGIQKLAATIDGKPVEFTDQSPASLLVLPELPVGSHNLAVWAIDSNGLAGTKVESKFLAQDKAPSIQSLNLIQSGTSRPFVNGFSWVPGKDDRMQVSAFFPNGFKSLEYRINGTAGTAKGNGSGTAGKLEAPLPQSLPWGLNSMEIIATGASGATTQRQVFFYHLAPADPQTQDDIGVYLDGGRKDGAGFVPIDPERPLRGFFNGRPIKSVAIEPADPDLSASFTGNSISVSPLRPTLSGPRQLVVTDVDGDVFRSETFTVRHDPEGPRITLAGPGTASWLRQRLAISGTVSDNLELAGLEYAISGQTAGTADSAPAGTASADTAVSPERLLVPAAGSFAPLDLGQATNDGNHPFQALIDLSGFRDGTVGLALRATDRFGNSTTELWAYSKDTEGPNLAQLTPPETQKVNGRNTMSGKARDAGRIVLVEFSSDRINWVPISNRDLFTMDLDFGNYARLPERWWWRATDAAGNVTEFNPGFNIDQEGDKPVVAVQTPVENETIRNDFKISGIAFDDDGIKNLYWRLDYQAPAAPAATAAPVVFGPREKPVVTGPGVLLTNPNAARDTAASIDLSTFSKLDGKNSFDLDMKLLDVGDNEHLFEIVGEDINGTIGNVVKQPFRISTAEPTSLLAEPATGITIRGTYTMSGTAADNNGIREVWLSFDNSSSWVKASGAEDWSYILDSTVLKDGVHSVIIKTIDNYDTEGLYNTIITIDNTAPMISLDTPRDGTEESGTLRLSGRLADNLDLASANVTLVPANLPINNITDTLSQELSTKTVLSQDLDISQLRPGWYTLRIEARDKAMNTSWSSRDIQVVETRQADRVEILFPVEQEVISGKFSISGRVYTKGELPGTVNLIANGTPLGDFPVSKTGHFLANIDPDRLGDGTIQLVAGIPNSQSAADSSDTNDITSPPRQFEYRNHGAWLQFSSFASGDYLSERIFLKGTAGYLPTPAAGEDDASRKAYQRDVRDHELKSVQISMDHGISWQTVSGTKDWSYRIETQNHPNGPLYMLFRLNLANDDMVVRHAIMTVDRTPPVLTVLKPGEEGRYNEKIEIAGTASDNYDLESIKVNLRTGDKAAYQVPAFIQGLYLDGHYGGSTSWEIGAGLTFFDNNVKLQANLGQAPPETRFDGWVLGIKLIANVLYLPFSYFFGPDLDFFSMSFGVGAQFNYLTMSGQEFSFSGEGVVLGAALVQWEFARFTFVDLSVFKTIGLYSEFQAWFISSDIQATVVPKIAFGGRVSIF